MTDISKTVAELREAYAQCGPILITYANTPSDDKEILTIRLEGDSRNVPSFQREMPTQLARLVGESITNFHTILDELERVTSERDAYKKAKQENDERFMLERDALAARLAEMTRESDAKTGRIKDADRELLRRKHDIDALAARLSTIEAELLRVRTAGHGAAHELDNIAVEHGLGHSPKPGVVAAHVRSLAARLKGAEEVIAEALEPGVFGPYHSHEDPALKYTGLLELCQAKGFGAVMSHVQWLWKTHGKHPGSEFTCAACASVRDRWIEDARTALDAIRGGEHGA